MSSSSLRSQEEASAADSARGKLPRSYYPIFVACLVLVMVAAIPPAVAIGLNPYIGMTLAGGFWVLREVWVLSRKAKADARPAEPASNAPVGAKRPYSKPGKH